MRERLGLEREVRRLVAGRSALGAVDREIDLDRAVRLNRRDARSVGWEGRRGAILTLLGLPAATDDRALADAVSRWQGRQPGLAVDGILGSNTWALMSVALDVDGLPAADRDAIVAAVGRILGLLNRPLQSSDTRGVVERRRQLRAEFESVPVPYAMRLYMRLAAPQAGDSLAQRFHGRLATETRNEMIAILARRVFREYELRFNPTGDRFSIDNNTAMNAGEKATRKQQVQDVIGDVTSAPGILWQRLLARQDAALEGKVPASLPAVPTAVAGAVRALSDAQIALFREWFPDGSGGIDFTPFQRVFEQFANGELRDPSVADHPALFEPNGSIFFGFAEFAFLCVETGLSPDLWTPALRTFVKIQEIFMHVYRERPVSPPPPVGAPLPRLGTELRDVAVEETDGRGFHFRNFKQVGASVGVGRGQSDSRRKAALRAKYDGMDVAAVTAAARDNLRRALLMR